jgi:hypothetical protein
MDSSTTVPRSIFGNICVVVKRFAEFCAATSAPVSSNFPALAPGISISGDVKSPLHNFDVPRLAGVKLF